MHAPHRLAHRGGKFWDVALDGLNVALAVHSPGHMPEVMGVKCVAIDYRAEGKRRSLRIPNLAEAEIEALSGQGGAEVTLKNLPLCIAPGQPIVVGKSGRLSYQEM